MKEKKEITRTLWQNRNTKELFGFNYCKNPVTISKAIRDIKKVIKDVCPFYEMELKEVDIVF